MTPITRFCLLLSLIFSLQVNGQYLLGKKIASFEVKQMPVAGILDKLGAVADIRIAYQSNLFSNKAVQGIAMVNTTVEGILFQLLGHEFEYAEQQGFIVIMKRQSYYLVCGRISDKETGKALKDVQIASASGLFTTTSDAAGDYCLKIPVCYKFPYINFRKELYQDAFVPIADSGDQVKNISLAPQLVQVLTPVYTAGNTGKGDSGKINVHLFGGRNRARTAFQAASLFNINLADVRNVQLAGAVNLVDKSMKGVQIAGMYNRVRDTSIGLQLAALVNRTNGVAKGLQIAAVNRAGRLRGVQIGFVNITDSSDGISIGLLNFVRNKGGYHSVSIYATDLAPVNLSVKLGNAKLYSVLMMGANWLPGQRLYSAGIGVGHDFLLSSLVHVSAECNYQTVNVGTWDNSLLQGKAALEIGWPKHYRLFAGPVWNHFVNGQNYWMADYKGYRDMQVRAYKESRNWIGWQAGITAVDWLWWHSKKQTVVSRHWTLTAGLGTGMDTKGRPWWSADLKVQKGVIANSVVWMLSAGVNQRFSNNLPQVGNFNGTIYALKSGLKVFPLGKFYIAGELGYTLNKMTDELYQPFFPVETHKHRLIWSPSIGWATGRIDLGARFESLQELILLRLGIRIL